MLYVDTSVFVTLLINETKSPEVNSWFTSCQHPLATSDWCVTEFASALALKQRTNQISRESASLAWDEFQLLCKNDLILLPAASSNFYKAAISILKSSFCLRSGDALHLAVALENKVHGLVSLDKGMLKNATQLKIKTIKI